MCDADKNSIKGKNGTRVIVDNLNDSGKKSSLPNLHVFSPMDRDKNRRTDRTTVQEICHLRNDRKEKRSYENRTHALFYIRTVSLIRKFLNFSNESLPWNKVRSKCQGKKHFQGKIREWNRWLNIEEAIVVFQLSRIIVLVLLIVVAFILHW